MVWPAASSTSCAMMCLSERNTTRRGRSAVPMTFLPTRRRRELDARGRLVLDRMREAQRELKAIGPHFGLEAHARDLELFGISLRDALDHVRDERTGEAVQRSMIGFLGGTLDVERVVRLV